MTTKVKLRRKRPASTPPTPPTPEVVSRPCPKCELGNLIEVLIPAGKYGYLTPPSKHNRYHVRCDVCRTYRFYDADKYRGIGTIRAEDLMGGNITRR